MFRFLTVSLLLVFIAFGSGINSAVAVTSAEDFGRLPQIYDAALSPNGDEIAVLANNDGQYVIRVMQLSNPTGTSRLVGLGPEMKPEYLKWVNNKRLIVSFWQSEKIRDTPIKAGYLYSLNTESM